MAAINGMHKFMYWQGWLAVLTLGWLTVGCGHHEPRRPSNSDHAQLGSAHATTLQHGRLPGGVVPKHYDLILGLDPNKERFSGQVSVSIELLEPRSAIVLHSAGLDFERVVVQDGLGRRHKVGLTSLPEHEAIRLDISPPMPAGTGTLYFTYSAAYNRQLTGLYRSTVAGQTYVLSQTSPLSARRVLPCFDEPHYKTSFTTLLTVPSDAMAISNTAAVGVRDAFDGRKVWAFEASPPLPTHLLTFAVGPWDHVATAASVSPQRPYTFDVRVFGPAKAGPGLEHALGRIGNQLHDLEAYTDLPYPFSKLDVVAAPELAYRMVENAACLSVREWQLIIDGPHAAYHKRRALEMTLAQGLAHQWFGAWVTMAWWDDAWLNDAFATWRGLRTASHSRPGMQFDLELLAAAGQAMDRDSLASARRVRQPCETAGDIYAATDPAGYAKGAALLHMFEHGLGKDKFREGVRTYLRRYPYQNANSQQFLAALESGAGVPGVQEAFSSFLDQPGLPELTFAWHCNGGHPELTISQERYQPLGGSQTTGTWTLPVCFKAGFKNKPHAAQATCVQLNEESTTIPLKSCPDWFVANVDGAGYYRSKVAFEQLPAVLAAMNQEAMSAPEWFAALDNFAAAIKAGSLPADTALDAIARGLQHKNPRIVRHALDLLRDVHLRYAPQDGQGVWRALIGHAQKSLLDGAKSDAAALSLVLRTGAEAEAVADRRDELALLRHDITHALATVAADRGTRSNLAHAGAHWLDEYEIRQPSAFQAQETGSGHQPAATLLPDDVALALTQAAQAFGRPFIDRMLKVLGAEERSDVRRHIVVALGDIDTEQNVDMLCNLAIDGRLRAQERLGYLQARMQIPKARAKTWAFVLEHLEDVLVVVPNKDWAGLIQLSAALCDAGMATALSQALAPHVLHMGGGERALQQALEQSALCAAERSGQSSGVHAFFSADAPL